LRIALVLVAEADRTPLTRHGQMLEFLGGSYAPDAVWKDHQAALEKRVDKLEGDLARLRPMFKEGEGQEPVNPA
jgi:hypothetical protein